MSNFQEQRKQTWNKCLDLTRRLKHLSAQATDLRATCVSLCVCVCARCVFVCTCVCREREGGGERERDERRERER